MPRELRQIPDAGPALLKTLSKYLTRLVGASNFVFVSDRDTNHKEPQMITFTTDTTVRIENLNDDGTFRNSTVLTLTKAAAAAADGTITLTGWRKTGRFSEEVQTITTTLARCGRLI